MSERKILLSMNAIEKRFGDVQVLKKVDMEVACGEVHALMGENGAGKSTTIECILGTREADSGTVRILGLNPWENRKQLFEQVGVQFQETNYPDKIKVRELCEETACLYRQPSSYEELLQKFDLADKREDFVSELSGGQKQKLFIVLALIPNPKVVFLDELTTGLDTKARRGVWKSLQELKEQGLTIFLSSHFMDEVEILCDRIGILKDGGFVFEGTGQEAVELSPYERLEDAYLWFTGEEETGDE